MKSRLCHCVVRCVAVWIFSVSDWLRFSYIINFISVDRKAVSDIWARTRKGGFLFRELRCVCVPEPPSFSDPGVQTCHQGGVCLGREGNLMVCTLCEGGVGTRRK